ncbi:MAG: UDP-N-acetylmuramoyl-L-alanyl-D-glutamate--2,6-diaminopimelate ligase [Desulfobacteraceae bacterium]|nr:MAG: UDP-N-acetylmuramoyl-L-alanyl-D-glutamate--2,6-diaminopimelate ligase [Desulfobacteraceae bacterium]
MKLSELLKAIHVKPENRTLKTLDPEIVSIHYRSDTVQPGGLFVAVPGFSADGHDYIDHAMERGAAAVVVQKPVHRDGIFIRVENSRKALSALAARFYSYPSEKMAVVGITGTNGKTTTSYLIESMLTASGIPCGVIGTVNYRYDGKIFENPMTTPESMDLHRILSEMVDAGIRHAVVEISSHAIDLGRVDNIRIRVGVFTNLSQDHLDYHGDMDSYWKCKKRFFTENPDLIREKDPAAVVLNCLNEKGEEIKAALENLGAKSKIITIGKSKDNGIEVIQSDMRLSGITAKVRTPMGDLEFTSPLVGRFNLENLLCAIGVGCSLGLTLPDIKKGIERFTNVPGRLESVVNYSGRYVFVDYAHTPDALENVLSTLRSLATGRLICVFGCGGDRDRSKRPLMGSIAGKLSDFCIVTSDNPRTEDKMAIIENILEGVRTEMSQVQDDAKVSLKGYLVEPDRKSAIRKGMEASLPGDTVLIAGKGHETYQIIGKNKFPFDDRLEAESSLRRVEM